MKSFKPIINIYLNIQKTYSKHGFNKFLHTSNNFTVAFGFANSLSIEKAYWSLYQI